MADEDVASALGAADPQSRGSSPMGTRETVQMRQSNAATAPASPSSLPAEPVPTTETPYLQPAHGSPSIKDASASTAADDAQAGSGPYSTRSRNRGNVPRPNYSEDIEMDFERPISRREADLQLRSSSAEGSSSMTTDAEQVRAPQTLKLHTRAPQQVDAVASNASLPPSVDKNSSSPIPGDGKIDTKKRKLNRTATAKPAANTEDSMPGSGSGSGRESMPGMSQFFAPPDGSMDAPLSKRRRTGDDVVLNGTSSRNGYTSLSTNRSLADACFVSFENAEAKLRNGRLEADDGNTYAPDDTVYLVCEPPGDPYYICRIMEFRHKRVDDKRSPVVSMLINWFYRPKDIGKFSSDSRHLYASMQSDECPLSSLRGKCIIKHRSEISNLDEYRRQRDTFHFNQLYDRYSHRPYEMISCSLVINVPPNVKQALDERWKYIVVEQQAVKELTSPPKNCKLCHKYCAPNDSVDCGVCRDTFHLGCVDPPLPKRPSRGFAWSCGPCSRDRERKLEQRHMTVPKGSDKDTYVSAIEQEETEISVEPGIITVPNGSSITSTTAAEPAPEHSEVARANMWPWRYLGVHCKLEDVLQNDDRAIYPRATSRTGNKHQAEVDDWPGRPFNFVKAMQSSKKGKGAATKKDQRLIKENAAQIQQDKAERAKRPPWVKDEPPGYIERGEDYDEADERCTAVPLFVKAAEVAPAKSGFVAANARGPPDDKMIDQYIRNATELANEWGLVATSKKGASQVSSNFLDYALNVLSKNKFNYATSLETLKSKHDAATLGNPDFTKEEIHKFENGVSKHGSDLRSVRRYYLRGRSHGEIVRFYYTWKFTQRGSEIWGNHSGRKGVKRRAESSWHDIADDEDDSAFDNDKATSKKRRFTCKFCNTRQSRQWRRAPGVAPGATVLADPKGGKDKSNQLILALCQRCAHPWRRYALMWEDPDEVARALLAAGGRQWKRKNDEELLRELVMANEIAHVPTGPVSANAAAQIGIEVTLLPEPRKKIKNGEKEQTPTLSASEQPRKKAMASATVVPRPPTPPPEPVAPKWRQLPCAVCRHENSPIGDELQSCRECKLTVHLRCYGAVGTNNPLKWVCDTCLNDKQNQHSLRYECALCPLKERHTELLELPKDKHKKKSERDKERERLEKKMYDEMLDEYHRSQKKKGRPIYPREALKITASNNWMHITCATWTPEIRFGASKALQHAEGMGAVASLPIRMEPVCKLCRISEGACVACAQCHAPFHVSCAHDAGYLMGFDVTPVKGSRKDPNQIVSIGPETGVMTAAIWCKDHAPKTIVHDASEVVKMDDGNFTALQLFAQTYKQADLTLTGTVRKANLVGAAARSVLQPVASTQNRRASQLVNGTGAKNAQVDGSHDDESMNDNDVSSVGRRCLSCGISFAFKWHRHSGQDTHMVNGTSDDHTIEYQCHKCFSRVARGLPPTSPKENAEPETALKPLTDPPDLFRAPSSKPHAPGSENLDRFAEDVKAVTITLTNPTFGGLHVFRGHEFNLDIDSDPTPLFRFITYWASQRCGYDQEHDVIVTEDGSWITWPKSMMQALVKMIVNGAREAHWRVVGARDTPCKVMDTNWLSRLKLREGPVHPLPNGLPHGVPAPPNGIHPAVAGPYPGPPGNFMPPGYPPPPMHSPGPPSLMRSGYPPHPVHGNQGPPIPPGAHVGPPPPQGHSAYGPQSLARPPSSSYAPGHPPPGQPPSFPPPDVLASRQPPPPPYFHRHSNSGSGTTSASPKDVPMGGGASSSPNLKNLMH